MTMPEKTESEKKGELSDYDAGLTFVKEREGRKRDCEGRVSEYSIVLTKFWPG